MRSTRVCLWLTWIVCGVLTPSLASTTSWDEIFDEIFTVCVDRLEEQNWQFPETFPIPVGCELVDCCPGCPDSGDLTWRISLSQGFADAVVLSFENVPANLSQHLTTLGAAEWIDGNRLQVNQGDSILSAPATLTPDGPPVAVAHLILNQEHMKQFLMNVSDGNGSHPGMDAVFVVEQVLDGVVVNETLLRYTFRRCFGQASSPETDTDIVHVTNSAGNDRPVILMDGRRKESGCSNDDSYRGEALGETQVNVGNVLKDVTPCNEVAVFSRDHAMRLFTTFTPTSLAWTDDPGDKFTFDQAPLLPVPTDIYILSKKDEESGEAAKTRVRTAIARANEIYTDMKCGIEYRIRDIKVATSDHDLTDVNCGDITDLWEIGHDSNVMNVYYVMNIENGAARGLQCGNDALVSFQADAETLAHEFGHVLDLGHTNEVQNFPGSNVMWSGGTGRESLTEGQCFRCNVLPESFLNSKGIRSGPTRPCPLLVTTQECPALSWDEPNE